MKTIPFEIIDIRDSLREGREWIRVSEKEDAINVDICKEFSTPGYSLSVDRIVDEGDTYSIYLDISPPSPGAMLLQVIAYKIVTIEINKAYLKEPPYVFKVRSNFPAYSRKMKNRLEEY